MKKLFTILMLIPVHLFGQTNSLVIKNKKSGKESTVNEGEIIRISNNINSSKGKFKLLYDSSVNTAIVKIEKPNGNYSIPVDQITSIKLYKTRSNSIKFLGNSMLVIGIPLEIFSFSRIIKFGRFGSKEYLVAIAWGVPFFVAVPIIIGGLNLSNFFPIITFHNRKYDFKTLK